MISHVNVGLYRLSDGESVQDVAGKVYGDVRMYAVLLKKNPQLEWNVGDIVKVPNKRGRVAVPNEGETTTEFITRVYRGHMAHQFLDKYLLWNAGLMIEELVGNDVFIPE